MDCGVIDMLTQLVDCGRPFPGPADVQETTFGLDAFSRFMCNTIDEVEEARQQGGFDFDVVVIGSGTPDGAGSGRNRPLASGKVRPFRRSTY